MKHLSREGFSEYAVGNPVDIKIFQIEKWMLTKSESFG
jgi:hypothetical protein